MLNKFAIAGLILVSGTSLLFCSGCTNSKEISYTSNGMTHTFSEGKGSEPKDFALPIYPGATTSGSVAATDSQEETQFLMLSTADSVDKVSEFYQDKMKAAGWTLDTVQPDTKLVHIDGHKDKLTGNIEIAEDGGKTTVSLSWGKAGDAVQDPSESAAENYKPDKVTPPTD